ncbi:hypothetical protein N7457_004503 [Penicillium paradoxum]|uniref:uncharacterized protein n=1 Tax=Penicillium paradoxum TaxID=176176 RepID=UPI002546EF54|nr:uncharacterized protein N7457_004503 [Penicillium paradoxum]KAJ5782729.1 hypothetical protein N7457_004503 [Penicillium paradoxum]
MSSWFSWRGLWRRSLEFPRPLLGFNEAVELEPVGSLGVSNSADTETSQFPRIVQTIFSFTQAHELPFTPPPAPTVPTFVDLPFGDAISLNSPHPSSNSDADLKSPSVEMSDDEPEVVDLTASTPRRRTAIPVSSSPPTAFDHLPPFSRGRQPVASRGIKRSNNQPGESSASASARANNISLAMDLTGNSGSIEVPHSSANIREPETAMAERPVQGEPSPKRLRPTLPSNNFERANPSEHGIHSGPKGPDENEPKQNSNPLLAYRCPICLETPECWTSSVCGHLFCHRCIYDHLEFSSRHSNGDTSKKSKGTCPVCRTPISRSDSGKSRGLVPIIFQTRKRDDPSPTV